MRRPHEIYRKLEFTKIPLSVYHVIRPVRNSGSFIALAL